VSGMTERVQSLRTGVLQAPQRTERAGETAVAPFAEQLRQALDKAGVHFSKHAARRIERREITVSGETLERLSRGTAAAAEKGARASLVLVDDLAFIVNVPTRTVVTAMGEAHRRGNVFTNIDSAVLA